ncbi:hypothetical protein ACFQE1_01935 [Halobium palmae]|uniref:DUF624 domain-containing protein n=1 Tax=Halobium palmae TaxID=1776492 RepID=A0ABD5RV77_9EURY
MSEQSAEQLDPIAALSAFLRISYSDLVTVFAMSLLIAIAAVPVVTLGGAILASVDTLTRIIRSEGRDEAPSSEWARIRYFYRSFRVNFRHGIPFGILLVAVVVVTGIYIQMAFTTQSTGFMLGSVIGLYAIVFTTVWVYRTASIVTRSKNPSGVAESAREAWHHLVDNLSWTSLQAILVAVLTVLLLWTRIGIVLLLPGMLTVLEVVVFEERNGYGAESLVLGYRGELRG